MPCFDRGMLSGMFGLQWEESEPWYLYLARRWGLKRKDNGLTLGDYWTQKGPR
jgi:hypothetical protein